jgi:hypothetical protein
MMAAFFRVLGVIVSVAMMGVAFISKLVSRQR